MIFIKYWRYFALVAGIVAVFAWHKNECSKSYNQGVMAERLAVAARTEQLRATMQARIDEAEAKSAETITVFQDRVKVVDREVIKKVFVECPDTFSEFKRLRNEYIRAGNANIDN